MQKKATTSYTEAVDLLFRCEMTNKVIDKVGDEIRIFKQGSLMLCDVSRNLCDLTRHCVGLYKKQVLGGFIVDRIDVNICSIMRKSWDDNQTTILEE